MRQYLPELREVFQIATKAKILQEQLHPHLKGDYILLTSDRMALTGHTMKLAEQNPKGAGLILTVALIVCFFRSVQERVRLLDQKNFLSFGFADVETAINFEEKILSQALWVISNSNWVKEISGEEMIQLAASYRDVMRISTKIVVESLPEPDGKSPRELCKELLSFIADGKIEAEALLRSLQNRRNEKEKETSLDKLHIKLESLVADRNNLCEALVRLWNNQSINKKIAVIASLGGVIASIRERIELLQCGSPAEVKILSKGYGATKALDFEMKILSGIIQQMDSVLERSRFSHSEVTETIKFDRKSPEECYKILHSLVCDMRKETWKFLETLEATEAKQVRGR